MAPKRKADAMDSATPFAEVSQQKAALQNIDQPLDSEKPAKKARKDASGSKAKAQEAAVSGSGPASWKDIELEVNEDGMVPVYDDCAEIRRKIRILQKDPKFKTAPWLREIGGINSNSFNRFMQAKKRQDGCGNRIYYAAYVYFEKVRIFEKKKKSKKREENEAEHPEGFSTEIPRQVAYIVPRGFYF
ncbi:hypothetical protein BDN70DRAFT_879209 [Pholiota conissans]|uniref:DUF7726 domain-containing protein n=1 Tax=Pholiota conissans TaxID=109636 RepID=A0A9P5Z099_9AGAR|nr:hypothetical protein BDN70DRAFT_879209 [Pholiota conissans]